MHTCMYDIVYKYSASCNLPSELFCQKVEIGQEMQVLIE